MDSANLSLSSNVRAVTLSARTLQNSSIRTKLVGLVTAAVLIPGLLYGPFAVASSRAALARATGIHLASEARQTADGLAAALRSNRDAVASAARQDVMRELRVGDLDKRISSFLTSALRGCASCLELLAVDERGTVVAASDAVAIGRVEPALPADAGAITGPVHDPTRGRRVVRVTARITDPDVPGRDLGVLVAVLDWERLTAVADRTREYLATNGIAADVLVVDANGSVSGGAFRPASHWTVGADARWALIPDAAVGAGVADDATGVLFGRARLPAELPPWTLVVAQPLAAALAPVRRMAFVLGGTLALAVLAVLGIALTAARRATRPLAELTSAARTVGSGGRAEPVPVRAGDEIGVLAAAFNRMAADLGRAEHRLVEAAKFAFVGELAGGVAHEVRTPLGVMRTATQLLERSFPTTDAEQRELLQMLRIEVDRIDRVVSDLLELGRPRAARVAATDLGEVLWRAADFVAVQASERGVTIVRRALQPSPRVACDGELMYQVVLNLLVNAIQAMEQGGTIEILQTRPADGRAGFEIGDDGPGIPADLRPTLFQPFATRRPGGTGLGLTFVQRVVLEHRGLLEVRDAEPHGTIFRIELPLDEGQA